MFEIIKNLIDNRFVLSILKNINMIEIRLSKENNRKIFTRMQCLPDDHIYESKVIDCIKFLREDIETKIKADREMTAAK